MNFQMRHAANALRPVRAGAYKPGPAGKMSKSWTQMEEQSGTGQTGRRYSCSDSRVYCQSWSTGRRFSCWGANP